MTLQNGTKIDAYGNVAYTDNDAEKTTYAVRDFRRVDAQGNPTGETHDYVVVLGTDGKAYIQDYHGNIHEVTFPKDASGKTIATASTADATATLQKATHTSTAGYDFIDFDNATAFGSGTKATNDEATAFGRNTEASGVTSTAFGENSTASGEAATAFGIGSTASGKNSLAALGGKASTENAIAVGKATEATNTNTLAVGNNAKATGEESVAIGFGIQENDAEGNPYSVTQTEASGESAIAIGTDTKATNQHSLAIGSHTDATADSTVAIGYDTHAASASSVAIGSGSKANSGYTIAIGLSALAGPEKATTTTEGSKSLAVGYFAQATKESNIALGYYAQAVNAKNATAVGTSANAETEGSVALGYGSDATRASGNMEDGVSKESYLKPTTVSTDKASIWTSTAGAVSVGRTNATNPSKNITRQITNVAAGSDDTDAVNVAQLKAAQSTVTSNDHSVTIDTTTDPTDYHKIYDLKIATATLSQEKTGTGDSAVETGKVTVTNPTYTGSDRKPVTNENAYVTGNSVADAINNSGFKLTASASEGAVTGNKETLIHPGDTVTIDAGKNISLTQDKGKISIATKDNLNLGSADSKDDKQQDVPGTNGSITVNGKNGSSVAINGQDGSIGLTGPKGTDGTSTSIQMSTIMSDPTLDDSKNTKTTSDEGEQQTTTTQAPRIQYKNGNTTYEVATMDDGQKYAGDVQASDAKANAFSRKLNEQTNIVGGVKNLDALSTGDNVGVVSNGTDTLTIRLAKELTDLTSVTTVTKDAKGNKTSETVQDGNGITITPTTVGEGKSSVSLTDKGLSNGGNQITHVDSGLKDATGNTVDLAAASGDVLNNAVNVGDLKKVQNVASAHTAVTVNGGVGAPNAEADGNLGSYTDKEKGNLLLAQKKDIKTGQITYDLKLNDNVILGKDGSDGKDGQEGTIGLTGKDGLPSKDGKQVYSTTIIKTEKGQAGADGKTGKENLAGTDMTRIVYTDKDGGNPQTVATLDDGLKFVGDDGTATPVTKKLNDTLQIRGDGTYDATTKTNNGNIQTSVESGTIKVALNKDINLKQNGSLTVGGNTQDGSTTIQDPIIIKHFDAGKLIVTGTDKDGKTPQSAAGDYVTGLDNKDWNVDKPEYVSGRAATEDQLKAISDTIKANADATASQHTEITVNDKANPTSVSTENIGQDGYGNYAGTENDNLLIAAKKDATSNKVTYNIKLNDQLAIGKNGTDGQDGKDGKDGKVTVETSKGTTVVIGHDGEPGKDGKDGISVTGKNGADGVSITGPNGADGTDGKVGISGTNGKDAVSISGKGGVGHIGLTGPEGEKGKDGISIDITTGLKAPTLDSTKNVSTTVKDASGKETTIEQAPRIQYKNGNTTYEVATMDDGQKYGGDNYVAATDKAAEQNVITKKLNERLDIQGGADKDKLTEQNIGVNVKDGVMKVQLAQNLNLTGNGSVTMGNTLIDNGGVTITTKNGDNTNTISLTEKGLNNGGKTITNVANGTNLNDAVNVSQLNAAKTTVTSSDNSISVTDTSNGTPNHAYDIKVATAILSNGTDGKVSVTNPNNNANSYATGNSVADAINNSGFTLTTSKSEGGYVSGTSTTFIKPGSTVTLNAGKNIALTQADSKVTIALSDDVTAQTITANGKNGNDGEIGLTGKNGADGTVTTIIKTIGKNGTDGKNGTPGVNGTDGITRIVYQDGKDGEAGTTPHTVATLDDGLKFIGDKTDDKAIAKKLGDILKIKGDGTYDAATQTNTSNIQTSVDGDAIKVALNKDINLKQDGSLTVGGNTQDGSKTVDDPIVIKHFDDETLDMITGVDKDSKPISANKKAAAGDYVTGLDNKDWNVDSPTYVSGRAATEDQLKTISDAVKEASTTAGKHTVVTVEGGKDAGTTDYNGEKRRNYRL